MRMWIVVTALLGGFGRPESGDGIPESLFGFSLLPFQFPGVLDVAHRGCGIDEGGPFPRQRRRTRAGRLPRRAAGKSS